VDANVRAFSSRVRGSSVSTMRWSGLLMGHQYLQLEADRSGQAIWIHPIIANTKGWCVRRQARAVRLARVAGRIDGVGPARGRMQIMQDAGIGGVGLRIPVDGAVMVAGCRRDAGGVIGEAVAGEVAARGSPVPVGGAPEA
jgi:hypothetical protein